MTSIEGQPCAKCHGFMSPSTDLGYSICWNGDPNCDYVAHAPWWPEEPGQKDTLNAYMLSADVARAGQLSAVEVGKADAQGPNYTPCVPYNAFRNTALMTQHAPRNGHVRGGAIVLATAIKSLAKKASCDKAWKQGARWDSPIMQLVGWMYVMGIAEYNHREGVLSLGTPQEIGSAIMGCPKGQVSTLMRRDIATSVERLCSVRLDELGWTDAGGMPALKGAHLMTSHGQDSEGRYVVQVGPAYMPGSVAKLRKQVMDNYGTLPADYEGAATLIPVQSRGLTLTTNNPKADYVPGSAPRTYSAQDRAYNLVHAHTVNHYHKNPGRGRGVDFESRNTTQWLADAARMPSGMWPKFLEHLVRLRHYKKDERGLYHPLDVRAVRWLKEGGRRIASKRSRAK